MRALILLLVPTVIALVPASAVTAQISERTIPASPPLARQAERASAGSPTPAIPSLATPNLPPATKSEAVAPSRTSTAAPPASASVAAGAVRHQAAGTHKYFPYTVVAGDTLGRIAQFFGVSVDALARANRLHPDAELYIGDKLRVPNPFEAERERLSAEVARLTNDDRASHKRIASAESEILSLKDHNATLTAANVALKHETRVLPWWRGVALGTGAATLLMFGVTVLTLFEWWMLRRRFLAVSDLATTLGHLDVKYKEALAKAELRMQQLYGRRRAGIPEGSEHSIKTQEEIEIERLNRQLKSVLEVYLERLGMRLGGAKARSRLREIMGDTDESTAREFRR